MHNPSITDFFFKFLATFSNISILKYQKSTIENIFSLKVTEIDIDVEFIDDTLMNLLLIIVMIILFSIFSCKN